MNYSTRINARISKNTYDGIKIYAKAQGVSVSEMIRIFLEGATRIGIMKKTKKKAKH